MYNCNALEHPPPLVRENKRITLPQITQFSLDQVPVETIEFILAHICIPSYAPMLLDPRSIVVGPQKIFLSASGTDLFKIFPGNHRVYSQASMPLFQAIPFAVDLSKVPGLVLQGGWSLDEMNTEHTLSNEEKMDSPSPDNWKTLLRSMASLSGIEIRAYRDNFLPSIIEALSVKQRWFGWWTSLELICPELKYYNVIPKNCSKAFQELIVGCLSARNRLRPEGDLEQWKLYLRNDSGTERYVYLSDDKCMCH